MDITDATYVVKAYVSADVPIFCWGERGIGKSSIVKQIADELKIGFIDLRLATQEVSDLLGMPYKDVTAGKTMWLKPEWFPEPGTQGILFLDEFNRAQRDVIQCVFQLVLDRRLHTHVLPEGWAIVAAGNYFGSYDVRELDEAMMSRFGHIDLETSHHAVCNYGMERGWVPRVTNFLRANPTFLLTTPEDSGQDKVEHYRPIPDPRRWEMVHRLISDGVSVFPDTRRKQHLIRMMLNGVVGEAAATAFAQYVEKFPSFEDIITGKKTLNEALAETLDKTQQAIACEKISLEAIPILKVREFDKDELVRVIDCFITMPRSDLIAGVLQRLAELNEAKQLKSSKWVEQLIRDPRVLKIFEPLMKSKNLIKTTTKGA